MPLAANPKSYRKIWAMLMLLSAVSLPLSGCNFLETFTPKPGDKTDIIDRQQKLSVDDFRDMGDLRKLEKSGSEPTATATLGGVTPPPVPDLAQVLAAPKPPKLANAKLVTLSVTEDVPIRDVLFELGRLAGVDIEIGSGLDSGGINLRATDRPFNEVIERISKLAHLRYSTQGNSIRVERDNPFIKNYSLDFLNTVRSSSSSYSLSTSILSASGGGSSSSSSSGSGGSSFGNAGSSSSISSAGESDLFSSLEASIQEILAYDPAGAAAPAAAASTGAASSAASGSGSGSYVVNRQSNVLTVNATEAQHEMIQRFLTLMSRNASAQVLIEAKIVEVSLADQFLSGIDWKQVIGDATKASLTIGNYTPTAISGGPSASTGAAFSLKVGDLDTAVSLTQKFGTARTLSSPRLSAINNQQAVLTFARNEVFFDCEAKKGDVVPSTGSGDPVTTQPEVSCKQNTVPIGIIMTILPSINLNTQEVTLNVRPTLTRKAGTVDNPANLFAAAIVGANADDITSAVPIIEVRELDSIMKIKSGGVMVIGGLMEDAQRNESTGVPGVQEVPMLGNLFKSRSEDGEKHELVIFIKATIVNSDGSAQKADRLIYDKFTTDPRPLFENEN